MSRAQRRADGLVGERLGDFELVRVLGRGGQGVVYLANQPSLEREVVVKVLEREDSAALHDEARLAARLDHPFAAHVYDHGVHSPTGRPWVAMERVRGTALDKLIALSGPPPTARSIALLERLAQVIDAAHAAGIAHGDIKPSNVVVMAERGRSLPKLIDFGLARTLDDRSASTAGSPAYQAPERWTGTPPDRPSDVYSFAALAYELLSGRPPERERVEPVGRGHSNAVDAALAAGLATDPAERPATAGELAAGLRAATVGGGESLALPPTLHADLIAAAPQPIAACFAAAAAAIGPHAQVAALRRGAGAICQYLGLLGLAAAPPDRWADTPLVRELGARRLAANEWLALARALIAGDRHPLPELAAALAAGAFDGVAALASTDSVADPDRERALGRDGIAALSRAVEAFGLSSYRIAAARGDEVEGWSGPSPGPRAASPAPAPLPAEVALFDRDGAPVFALSPLVARARPSPHHPEELFLFAGADNRGLRAVAPAAGFEIGAGPVREWLAGALAERDAGAAPERQPYRGLAAYRTADADLFVGRERELDDALNHLRTEPLLAIAGPSGVGKSSLARAGIAASWPGAVAIARPADAAGAPTGPGSLVVVDQLEELFTHELTGERRARLARWIAGAARNGARVVVTIRDDYLGAARQLPELGPMIARGLLLLAPPGLDDLARIAREPLERVGYRWGDPAIPAEIATAVAGEAGALALVSFYCEALWDARDRVGRQITRASVDALGGVHQALARHADGVLESAPTAERAAIRRVLLALITGAGTRWRRPAADALAAAGPLGPPALERLIRARLVVSRESESGADEIELIHESLIDGWPALRTWRARAEVEVALREQVEEAAERWRDRDEPPGVLWSGDALSDIDRLLARSDPGLSALGLRFAEASVRAARRRRRWRVGLIAIAGLALAAAAVIFFALARRAETARDAEVAERARATARLADFARERGRAALIDAEPGRALRFLHTALESDPDNRATRFLTARALAGIEALELAVPTDEPITGVALDLPGARLLIQGEKAVAIHQVGGGARIAGGPSTKAYVAPRWLRDDLVALNVRGGDLALWNLSEGARAELPVGKIARRLEVRGGYLLIRTSKGRTRLVRLATGESLWTTGELGAADAGFLRDERVVLAEKGRVTVRERATGEVVRELATGEVVHRVAADGRTIFVTTASEGMLFDQTGELTWRSDAYARLDRAQFHGSRIVAVDDRQDLVLIDRDDGRTVARIAGGGARINALAISDRGVIAVGRDGGAVELYLARTGLSVGRLIGHHGAVRSLGFDESGAKLATGGDDGVARVWDVATASGARTLDGRLAVGSAFDPSSERIALSGGVLDLETGETLALPDKLRLVDSRWIGDQPRLLVGDDRRAAIWSPAGVADGVDLAGKIRNGALAPGGSRAAVVDYTGALTLLGGGETVVIKPGPRGKVHRVAWLGDSALLVGHADSLVLADPATGAERALIASDDPEPIAVRGDRVAVGYFDRLVLYQREGDRLIERGAVELGRQIGALAIAPDGSAVASCGRDGALVIVAFNTGVRLADVAAHGDACVRVVYAGDSLIASAGGDRMVRIWSADRLALLAERAGASPAAKLAATAAGDRLAASTGGDAVLWDLGLYSGTAADLARALDCRIPDALVDGRFVRAATLPERCRVR